MYSSRSDILKQIPDEELKQLSSEDGSTIDDAVVNKAIADADAEIDSYIAKYYTVPLVVVPARVNSLSVTIALKNLYSRRPALEMPKTIKSNYDDALGFLEMAARNQVSLGVDPPPPRPSIGTARTKHGDRKFTDKTMEGL